MKAKALRHHPLQPGTVRQHKAGEQAAVRQEVTWTPGTGEYKAMCAVASAFRQCPQRPGTQQERGEEAEAGRLEGFAEPCSTSAPRQHMLCCAKNWRLEQKGGKEGGGGKEKGKGPCRGEMMETIIYIYRSVTVEPTTLDNRCTLITKIQGSLAYTAPRHLAACGDAASLLFSFYVTY